MNKELRDLVAAVEEDEKEAAEHTEVIGPTGKGKTAFLEGSFALYATADGGIVLATNTNLHGQRTTRVPKFVVSQARRGNPELAEILDRARE